MKTQMSQALMGILKKHLYHLHPCRDAAHKSRLSRGTLNIIYPTTSFSERCLSLVQNILVQRQAATATSILKLKDPETKSRNFMLEVLRRCKPA